MSNHAERSGRWILPAILVVQGLLFVLLPLSGSPASWGVFSSFNAEIAHDLISGPGASPWDGYDGLVAGPLALGLIQAPLLALLGRIGLVHVLGMGLVALAATALTWSFCVRHLGRPAALAATLLVAFPPPNTWLHQHVGAHHLLGPALVPAAMLLLWPSLDGREGRRRPWLSEAIAWTLLAGVVFLTPTTISLAVPLGAGWWLLGLARSWRSGRVWAWMGTVPPALVGTLLAAGPLLYKGLIHERFGGLVPPGGATAAQNTKPLFLLPTAPLETPGRLLEMVAVDLPYGLHFGLHGLAPAGVLWVLVAGAALGLLAWQLRRGGDRAWLPLLAVPPAVLVVGLCTGWFVFHPGEAEPFLGDARHLLGITWALSLCVGAAVGLAPGRARWAAWGLVGLLVLASVVTQLGEVRWGELEPDPRTPWRLEARFFHGFFAGPAFEGGPAAAAAACSRSEEPQRSDCLRGVAMAWGHGTSLAAFGGEQGRLDELREVCAALEAAAGPDGPPLGRECWFGLGFGLAHLQFQAPERALPLCRDAPGLSEGEVLECGAGVGFGFAQDFGFRPQVMRRWFEEEVQKGDRGAWATGVGVYAGILSRRAGFVEGRCGELVGDYAGACVRAARRNDRYMSPIR